MIGPGHNPAIDLNSNTAGVPRWLMALSTGDLYWAVANRRRSFASKFAVGDTIGVVLDLDNHGLMMFYLNDQLLGIAFSGVRGPVSPAVALYNVNDKVLIESKKEPPAVFPLRPTLPIPFVFDTSISAEWRSSSCLSVMSTRGGWHTIPGTVAWNSGTRYWETTLDAAPSLHVMFGVVADDMKVLSIHAPINHIGNPMEGYALYGINGQLYTAATGATWDEKQGIINDVIRSGYYSISQPIRSVCMYVARIHHRLIRHSFCRFCATLKTTPHTDRLFRFTVQILVSR